MNNWVRTVGILGVFVLFVGFIAFRIDKVNEVNEEKEVIHTQAVERCRPYQVQTYDDEVTVCITTEGYTVIRNEKQHVN